MKFSNILIFAFFILFGTANVVAQSNTKTFSLKKGEVLDIFFLTRKPDIKDKLKDYFATASPIAKKLSYTSLGGFPITESPSLGNYHPELVIFASWESLAKRDKASQELVKKIPDFHQRRRDIWSTFDMTYYELKRDLTFDINFDQYNVVTSFWEKDAKKFKQFKKTWLNEVEKAGGKVKLNMQNGVSPFGYYHNPDLLIITEWENKAAFEAFQQKVKIDEQAASQVNQFKVK